MSGVTFDGENKLIIIDFGIIAIDVKKDLYSGWKRWFLQSDNAKFAQAFSVVGGEPTVAGRFLGSTFFLENGWKVRPHEADHRISIEGNIFSSDGSNPFVPTLGNFQIVTELTVSNLTEVIVSDPGAIADSVWNALLTDHQVSGSTGKAQDNTDKNTKLIPGLV